MKKFLFLLIGVSSFFCCEKTQTTHIGLQLTGHIKSCAVTTYDGVKKFDQWVPDGEGRGHCFYTFNKKGHLSTFISEGDTTTYTYIGDTAIVKNDNFGTLKTVFQGENPIAIFIDGKKDTDFFYKNGKLEKIINGNTITIATHDGNVTTLKCYSTDGRYLKHMRKTKNGLIIGGQGGSLTNTFKYDEKPFEVLRDSTGLPFGTINARINNIDDISPEYVWADLGDEYNQIRNYIYTYDERGNWITRASIYKGYCEEIVVREITYQ